MTPSQFCPFKAFLRATIVLKKAFSEGFLRRTIFIAQGVPYKIRRFPNNFPYKAPFTKG